jgi:hypothetical protein
VKYLIMVYGNPSALAYFEGLSDAERREAVRVHAGVREALTASGELISSASLQGPAAGTRVSVRDTGPVVTDGPFAEVKEHLAGFYLIDCPSRDRAVEIAAQVAAIDAGEAEVRPVRDLDAL